MFWKVDVVITVSELQTEKYLHIYLYLKCIIMSLLFVNTVFRYYNFQYIQTICYRQFLWHGHVADSVFFLDDDL
jgi:hypothetical protein